MNEPTKNFSHKTGLLAKCLLASLALHSAAIYFFIQYPISIKEMGDSFFQNTTPIAKELDPDTLYDPKDSTLDDFFAEFAANRPTPAPQTLKEILAKHPLLLENSQDQFLVSTSQISGLEEHVKENQPLAPVTFTFEPEEPIALAITNVAPSQPPVTTANAKFESPSAFLPADEFLIAAPLIDDRVLSEKDLNEQLSTPDLENISTYKNSAVTNTSPSLEMEVIRSSEKLARLFMANDAEQPLLEKPTYTFPNNDDTIFSYRQNSTLEIDDYLPTKALYSLKWNDNFDIKTSFFPDGDSYIFSITVTPTQNLEEERIKQNTYFLIDTSSEIEKHKITVFKKSVFKALSSLQEGDFFNIYLLDKTTEKLTPYNLKVSLPNIRLAQEFLEKHQEKPFFASFDLLKGLQETLKQIPEDDEVHTVILLTNGKLTSNPSVTKKEITKLLEKNEGKINLFTITAGKNNNIVNLDMLSSLFGGKLLYSDTNASLPRKLGSFIKSLHSPLIKDISISLETADPKANISIFPLNTKTPNLHQKEPFIIMGKINRLTPISLTLEGRNEEGWILLQKELDFEMAEESSNAIKKEWELRQTASLYGKFLEDSKSIHLKEAKEVLKTAHGRTLGE